MPASGRDDDAFNNTATSENAMTGITLRAFAMTVEPLHLLGANIVRCPALGTALVFITDDFGNFIEAPCAETMMYAACGSEHGPERRERHEPRPDRLLSQEDAPHGTLDVSALHA